MSLHQIISSFCVPGSGVVASSAPAISKRKGVFNVGNGNSGRKAGPISQLVEADMEQTAIMVSIKRKDEVEAKLIQDLARVNKEEGELIDCLAANDTTENQLHDRLAKLALERQHIYQRLTGKQSVAIAS